MINLISNNKKISFTKVNLIVLIIQDDKTKLKQFFKYNPTKKVKLKYLS